MDDEKLLTPAEVMEKLGIKKQAFYRLVNRGGLPVVKVGASLRVNSTAVDAYMRGESPPVTKAGDDDKVAIETRDEKAPEIPPEKLDEIIARMDEQDKAAEGLLGRMADLEADGVKPLLETVQELQGQVLGLAKVWARKAQMDARQAQDVAFFEKLLDWWCDREAGIRIMKTGYESASEQYARGEKKLAAVRRALPSHLRVK